MGAALAPVALDYVNSMIKTGQFDSNSQPTQDALKNANIIFTVAVLSIMITAPVFAPLMELSGKRWLAKDDQAGPLKTDEKDAESAFGSSDSDETRTGNTNSVEKKQTSTDKDSKPDRASTWIQIILQCLTKTWNLIIVRLMTLIIAPLLPFSPVVAMFFILMPTCFEIDMLRHAWMPNEDCQHPAFQVVQSLTFSQFYFWVSWEAR